LLSTLLGSAQALKYKYESAQLAEWLGGISIVVLENEVQESSTIRVAGSDRDHADSPVNNQQFIAAAEQYLVGIEHYYCYLNPGEELCADLSKLELFTKNKELVEYDRIIGRSFFTLRIVKGLYAEYHDFEIMKKGKSWSSHTADPLLAPIVQQVQKRERFQRILNDWMSERGYLVYTSGLQQAKKQLLNDKQIEELRAMQKKGLDINGRISGTPTELSVLLQQIIDGKRIYQALVLERFVPFEKAKGKKLHKVNYRHYYYLDAALPPGRRVMNSMEGLIRLLRSRFINFTE